MIFGRQGNRPARHPDAVRGRRPAGVPRTPRTHLERSRGTSDAPRGPHRNQWNHEAPAACRARHGSSVRVIDHLAAVVLHCSPITRPFRPQRSPRASPRTAPGVHRDGLLLGRRIGRADGLHLGRELSPPGYPRPRAAQAIGVLRPPGLPGFVDVLEGRGRSEVPDRPRPNHGRGGLSAPRGFGAFTRHARLPARHVGRGRRAGGRGEDHHGINFYRVVRHGSPRPRRRGRPDRADAG